jgi:hypothetical protein
MVNFLTSIQSHNSVWNTAVDFLNGSLTTSIVWVGISDLLAGHRKLALRNLDGEDYL